MTWARMRVSDELAEGIRLPPGFDEVWCRATDDAGTQEWLVTGPFDESVPDGADVQAVVYAGTWQWVHNGEPAGPAIAREPT